MLNILYLHGFNSAGNGNTTAMLRAAMPDATVHSPTYPGEQPLKTLDMLTALVNTLKAEPAPFLLVGTSLGAFWARVLSQQCGVRALMVNPAVCPSVQLRRSLGPNTNFATGDTYDFNESALDEYRQIERLSIVDHHVARLAMVYENDEVIDVATTCETLVQQDECVRRLPGGQHRIFAGEIPAVVQALRELAATFA